MCIVFILCVRVRLRVCVMCDVYVCSVCMCMCVGGVRVCGVCV